MGYGFARGGYRYVVVLDTAIAIGEGPARAVTWMHLECGVGNRCCL